MDFKKACLKVRSVLACLLFLIMLSLSFVDWLIPATVEASWSVVVPAGSASSNALTDTTQTTDIAIGSGGVIYVTLRGIWGASQAYSNRILIKSINYGTAWTDITSSLPSAIINTDYVALAPDDANLVVVVDKTSFNVCLSTNGGITWTSLGQPPMTAINDIAISPIATGGVRHVAVAGVAGGIGAVYYYSLGIVAPSWENAVNTPTWTNPPPSPDAFWAVEFSPNFAADQTMLAVSARNKKSVWLNAASFNSLRWNSAMDVTFPRKVIIPSDFAITSADIALDPSFILGDVEIGFIGASITNNVGDKIGGVYRVDTYTIVGGNYTMTQLLTGAINSVAWDDIRLVAGAYDSNIVYRSTNPTSLSPTFSTTSGSDAPGGEKNTFVAFSGDYVIAATGGSGSGISRSNNGGATFQMILPYNLASPILLYPPNNANGIAQSPAFSWQAVPYAASYRFELATDSTFTVPLYTADSPQTSLSLPPTLNLQMGKTYYWRVKCLIPVESPWSSTYAFTVNPPPITTETSTITQTTTPPAPPKTDGFPIGPVAGGVAGGATAIGGGILVKRWLDKKNIDEFLKRLELEKQKNLKKPPEPQTKEEIEAKLKEAGIEIKIGNKLGKPEVKTDTPTQMEKVFSIKVVIGPGKHTVKAEG